MCDGRTRTRTTGTRTQSPTKWRPPWRARCGRAGSRMTSCSTGRVPSASDGLWRRSFFPAPTLWSRRGTRPGGLDTLPTNRPRARRGKKAGRTHLRASRTYRSTALLPARCRWACLLTQHPALLALGRSRALPSSLRRRWRWTPRPPSRRRAWCHRQRPMAAATRGGVRRKQKRAGGTVRVRKGGWTYWRGTARGRTRMRRGRLADRQLLEGRAQARTLHHEHPGSQPPPPLREAESLVGTLALLHRRRA